MNTSKTPRISIDNLADMATQSAKRAMDVRESVGIELSTEEIEAISGAVSLGTFGSPTTSAFNFDKLIIAGGIWGDRLGGQFGGVLNGGSFNPRA